VEESSNFYYGRRLLCLDMWVGQATIILIECLILLLYPFACVTNINVCIFLTLLPTYNTDYRIPYPSYSVNHVFLYVINSNVYLALKLICRGVSLLFLEYSVRARDLFKGQLFYLYFLLLFRKQLSEAKQTLYYTAANHIPSHQRNNTHNSAT
jgi:hypothetical protein